MSSYKYMKKIQEGFYLVFPGYLASFLEVFSCSVHFCAVHFLTLFLLLSGSISPPCISLPSPAQLTRGQISFHDLKGSPLRKKKTTKNCCAHAINAQVQFSCSRQSRALTFTRCSIAVNPEEEVERGEGRPSSWRPL